MLGKESNLGFNSSKHTQYLGDEGEVRGQFHDDIVDLLGNYQGKKGETVDVLDNIVQMNPNYE